MGLYITKNFEKMVVFFMDIIRIHFSVVNSTNTWSKENFETFEKNKITLVTADLQSAGRGRFNRRWESPAKQNLYATFNFCIDRERIDIGNIPQILAISTCEIFENLILVPQLKWPNDILISNKKVGGILCETIDLGQKLGIILGIGLNINMPLESLKSIDQPATSLKEEKGTAFNPEYILQNLQRKFVENLHDFLKNGFSQFLEKYKGYLGNVLGKKIHFINGIKQEEGIFHSVNSDGSVNILLESGEVRQVVSGEVSY